jgi:hypothetical protein
MIHFLLFVSTVLVHLILLFELYSTLKIGRPLGGCDELGPVRAGRGLTRDFSDWNK